MLAMKTSYTGASVVGPSRAATAAAMPFVRINAAAQPKRPKPLNTPAISPPKLYAPIRKV